jgi:hypothetical protein
VRTTYDDSERRILTEHDVARANEDNIEVINATNVRNPILTKESVRRSE